MTDSPRFDSGVCEEYVLTCVPEMLRWFMAQHFPRLILQDWGLAESWQDSNHAFHQLEDRQDTHDRFL